MEAQTMTKKSIIIKSQTENSDDVGSHPIGFLCAIVGVFFLVKVYSG